MTLFADMHMLDLMQWHVWYRQAALANGQAGCIAGWQLHAFNHLREQV